MGRTKGDVVWSGTTFPAGSYVVSMRQAFRGFAYTALAAGQDISERISQLYAPPGAWSHGSLWGADVIEVPAGDTSFNPATTPVVDVYALQGGVRSGPADWYAPNVTWFESVPTGATVDGRYLPSVDSTFVAGLWRDRDRKAAGAPIILRGTTLVGSRCLALATNPFSRGDAEREWPLIGQAALWSNLTDD